MNRIAIILSLFVAASSGAVATLYWPPQVEPQPAPQAPPDLTPQLMALQQDVARLASAQLAQANVLTAVHQDLLRQEAERAAIRQQASARVGRLTGDADAILKAVPR